MLKENFHSMYNRPDPPVSNQYIYLVYIFQGFNWVLVGEELYGDEW